MSEPTSRKLRSACDRCHLAKIRCLGGKEPCVKCQKDNVPCRFSYRTHVGKPKGSLNKRTIERLKGVIETSTTDSAEARYAQSLLDCSRNGSSSRERTLSQSTARNVTEQSAQDSPQPQEQSNALEETSLGLLGVSISVLDSPSQIDLDQAVTAADDQVFALPTPIWQELETSPTSTSEEMNSGLNSPGEENRLEALMSLVRSATKALSQRVKINEPIPGFVELSQAAPFPAINLFQTPATSYCFPTPGRDNYEQPCSCTQGLANCISEVRAREKSEVPLRLDANLHSYDRPLASVTSALQCAACSVDTQIILLAAMVMTTVVRWVNLLVQPAIAMSPFRVQYGEFGEFVASEDASDIVRVVLTGQAFSNIKETLSLLKERVGSLVDSTHQTELLRLQVDSLMTSFEETKGQFKIS